MVWHPRGQRAAGCGHAAPHLAGAGGNPAAGRVGGGVERVAAPPGAGTHARAAGRTRSPAHFAGHAARSGLAQRRAGPVPCLQPGARAIFGARRARHHWPQRRATVGPRARCAGAHARSPGPVQWRGANRGRDLVFPGPAAQHGAGDHQKTAARCPGSAHRGDWCGTRHHSAPRL